MHSQWTHRFERWPFPRAWSRIGWRPIAAIGVAIVVLIGAIALGAARQAGTHDANGNAGGLPGLAVRTGPSAPEERAAVMTTGAPAFSGTTANDAKASVSSAGASVAPAPAAGGTGTDLPTIDAGRTIIRSGKVDLTVKSVGDAFAQVSQIAAAAGGFVADSTFAGSGDHSNAYLTIRVPQERFGDVIAQLRGLAVEVRSINTSANDVTDQYTDLEATLANLRAVEAQYVQLLGRAGTIGDVLQVQDRLNQVRLQIDRTEARRKVLESQSTLSTIAVTLQPVAAAVEPAPPASGPLAAAQHAWQASLQTLERIATAVLVVVVYGWWLVIAAGVAGFFVRRRLRRGPAADVAPAASNGA